MKKTVKIFMSALIAVCICFASLTFVGCSDKPEKVLPEGLSNGGFETSDLSGWTIESGKAFDNDSVSSVTSFSFDYDSAHKQIPVNQTGNWYLSGKGFDGKRNHGYTGSIRSHNFVLRGDGVISLKLAGGALVTRKGENAPLKSREKICYVGVYRASDDMLLTKFTNKYFLEHTEDFVNVSDYTSGVCCTDNFYRYRSDLSEYIGEEMYIRIVDNDTDVYYGYISVDDIRIGNDESQETGRYYVKTHDYVLDVDAPSEHEIKNGGFETGSLAGWTVVLGEAFSNDGVNSNEFWWNESIPYKRDGNYHYGFYKPSAVGVMRSSEFVLGGSGYITYKLGGCRENALTYLRFMVKDGDDAVEVARYSNFMYWDFQFPYVQNGMRLLNLVQYYADFSPYLGKTMYIEVVDENTSPDDIACITLDSVQTYWEHKPEFYYSVAYEAKMDPDSFDMEVDSPYQVKNGTFETGDLTGWTLTGGIGVVSDAFGWWDENFTYNKKGKYLFTGIAGDTPVGTLTSEAFEVNGAGISFRFGGASNPTKCYISIIDAQTEEELARFGNLKFHDEGTDNLNGLNYLANMVEYKASYADLDIAAGTSVKIRVTDNSTAYWGLVVCDSFITYYESADYMPKTATQAVNLLPVTQPLGADDENQILNGDFETGDLTGWSVVSGSINADAAVTTPTSFWVEGIPYNNGGIFHFNGFKAAGEGLEYALQSTNFKLDGSGFISFKLGGRTAVLEVYDASDDSLIASYQNTGFADKNFPKVDEGCRLATMVTYLADLSAHKNKTLYIVIKNDMSVSGRDWSLACFDDIITYYQTAPVLSECKDTVMLSRKCSSTGSQKAYDIDWIAAQNKVQSAG